MIELVVFKDCHISNSSKTQREVDNMRQLADTKCNFVVEFKNSWIVNDIPFIQMEYCFNNLKNILKIKHKIFKQIHNQSMNSIEYFISCEIFRQITEALNYLHSLKPEPLIHRDLKPENILIGMSENKRICKLADFGLSKFIENCSGSHTKYIGTPRYTAPEIRNGHRYDITADIYSLGIIAQELFEIGYFNSERSSNAIEDVPCNNRIIKKITMWDGLISSKMSNSLRHQRISCGEVLTQILKLEIPKNSIPETEIQLFYKKIEIENNLSYFIDILDNLP